jgi:hypothetical protein
MLQMFKLSFALSFWSTVFVVVSCGSNVLYILQSSFLYITVLCAETPLLQI